MYEDGFLKRKKKPLKATTQETRQLVKIHHYNFLTTEVIFQF